MKRRIKLVTKPLSTWVNLVRYGFAIASYTSWLWRLFQGDLESFLEKIKRERERESVILFLDIYIYCLCKNYVIETWIINKTHFGGFSLWCRLSLLTQLNHVNQSSSCVCLLGNFDQLLCIQSLKSCY